MCGRGSKITGSVLLLLLVFSLHSLAADVTLSDDEYDAVLSALRRADESIVLLENSLEKANEELETQSAVLNRQARTIETQLETISEQEIILSDLSTRLGTLETLYNELLTSWSEQNERVVMLRRTAAIVTISWLVREAIGWIWRRSALNSRST